MPFIRAFAAGVPLVTGQVMEKPNTKRKVAIR
jgi:hypothetical protein